MTSGSLDGGDDGGERMKSLPHIKDRLIQSRHTTLSRNLVSTQPCHNPCTPSCHRIAPQVRKGLHTRGCHIWGNIGLNTRCAYKHKEPSSPLTCAQTKYPTMTQGSKRAPAQGCSQGVNTLHFNGPRTSDSSVVIK